MTRTSCFKTRENSGGFTLLEVMIALAIVALTAVVLLEQRGQVVRDAARARDLRTAWVLASQKMGELELDKTLWTGQGSQLNGDFGDVDPDYSVYQWAYQIVREPIDISDPLNPTPDKQPPELLRLTLEVRTPGYNDPLVLEAEFPIDVPPPAPASSGDSQTPPSGTPGPGDPGGVKK